MINRIHWLGGNSFVLQGPPLIYINPVNTGTRSTFLADVILVSQASYETCSPRVIKALRGPETLLIANTHDADCLDAVGDVQVLRPWQSVTVDRARITAVSSPPSSRAPYGTVAPPVGFLISVDYYDIYYAGDTAVLPDTVALRPDIAILPVRNVQTGLLELEQAVAAVKRLQPRWVIPSHWRAGVGREYLDVKAFESALGTLTEVVIPAAAK